MPDSATLANLPLADYIAAAGSLGTAAFAIVDASKALWGGISNAGFGDIKRVIRHFYPANVNEHDRSNPLHLGSVLDTLRANWLNGTTTDQQKALAKTLIKLRLDANNAAHLAAATGVDAATLTAIANSIANGTTLTQPQSDVFGRFDVIVSTLLDEGYQRASQKYTASAQLLSLIVAVLLALIGGWAWHGGSLCDYVNSRDIAIAFVTGLIATPIAPVTKDLTTGLAAAMQAVGLVKGKKPS